MHLQEARRADPAATHPAVAGTAGPGAAAAQRAVTLAIPFARGFDAVGMGATVVVHLPLTDEPEAAGPDDVRPVPAEVLRTAAPGAPWIVAGLKLLALAAGLGCAYLAGGALLGAPDSAGPRMASPQAQPLQGPAR